MASRRPPTTYSTYLLPRGMIILMRVKTSVTLPEELIRRLDGIEPNRSAILERAAREYLDRLDAEERDRRDIEIINRHSRRLNREAADTLGYQKLP